MKKILLILVFLGGMLPGATLGQDKPTKFKNEAFNHTLIGEGPITGSKITVTPNGFFYNDYDYNRNCSLVIENEQGVLLKCDSYKDEYVYYLYFLQSRKKYMLEELDEKDESKYASEDGLCFVTSCHFYKDNMENRKGWVDQDAYTTTYNKCPNDYPMPGGSIKASCWDVLEDWGWDKYLVF